MSVDHADPGRGDPAGVLAASLERASKAESVRSARDELLRAAAEADPSVWSGAARDAFVGSASAAAAEMELLASRWDAESAALGVYSRGLGEIKDQQRLLELRSAEASYDLRTYGRLLDGANGEMHALSFFIGVDTTDVQRRIDHLRPLVADASERLTAAGREWGLLVDRRAQVNQDCIAALGGADVLGPLAVLSDAGGSEPGDLLAQLSATDLLVLSLIDQETMERLSHTDPDAVQRWWSSLDAGQQDALVAGMPAFIGALNGVPPMARVAANRLLAAAQLRKLENGARIPDVNGQPTVRTEFGAGADLIRYLQRVVDGEVQLYLWQPENGAIIEMSGDPDMATGALFVLPGTNASISEFTSAHPTTAFAKAQVDAARPPGSVVAFTVLTGPMPYLTADLIDFWSNGPQNNAFAEARAPEVAAFERGIFATMPGAATVTYEHSYATAVGSRAEDYGGTPTVRVYAGGVGAMNGYQPDPDVVRYAMQAPNDINRYYAGLQIGEVGFGVAPESIPGIQILDSGMGGLPMSPTIAAVESSAGVLVVGAQIPASVDNHVDMMSGDLSVNGTAFKNVWQILHDAGKR